MCNYISSIIMHGSNWWDICILWNILNSRSWICFNSVVHNLTWGFSMLKENINIHSMRFRIIVDASGVHGCNGLMMMSWWRKNYSLLCWWIKGAWWRTRWGHHIRIEIGGNGARVNIWFIIQMRGIRAFSDIDVVWKWVGIIHSWMCWQDGGSEWWLWRSVM